MIVKIYHLHVPKTAGTSLNEWLDDAVAFEKARPPKWHDPLLDWLKDRGIAPLRACSPVSRMCWSFFDVIHDHKNILSTRPSNAVTLTILRDPIDRAISFFLDKASLNESDFAHESRSAFALQKDGLVMPFSEFHRKWSRHPAFGLRYTDRMCRSFLAYNLTYRQFARMTPEERFMRARENIERHVDAVGITEQMDKSVHYFSQVLGLYPRNTMPNFNVGRRERTAITDEDRLFLSSITVGDRMLYEYFQETFDRLRVDYSVEAFEKTRLREAIQRVDVKRFPGKIIYEMRAALIGTGFWGRDSRGKPDCCRWTGPQDDAVIYVPSFEKPTVSVAVDVRGWLSPDARRAFRVKVWGEPVEHRFEPGENLADVVRFQGRPLDGILKLEFHALARTDDEAGNPNSDGRRKGMLINCIVVSARAG